MPLAGFDSSRFLRDSWQREPLLIRQALPDFQCPLDGNDLAGLACEEGVESRFISGREDVWTLRNGPFDEDFFQDLPGRDWTLLVQRVDQWFGDIAALLRHFDFLPQWRIDDIMVSYAVPGGGVGPHFDRYDVFLIQGSGQREWRLGQHCDDSEALLSDQPLRLLADFQERERHVLQPGDILYIPPGTAHWGTALSDDCITLSVGFRAPSLAQILERWWDNASAELTEDQRYRDIADTLAAGQTLDARHIRHLRVLLSESLSDDRSLIQSFGELVTESTEEFLPHSEPRVVPSGQVSRALDSRLTLYQDESRLLLFANGMSADIDHRYTEILMRLCRLTPGEALPDADWKTLLNQSPEAASFLLSTGALVAEY